MGLPALDNHDPRIRYYQLMLEEDIAGIPELPALDAAEDSEVLVSLNG